MSLKQNFHEFVQVVLGGSIDDGEEKQPYDVEYIQEKEYNHLTVGDEIIRCEVCGKQYKRDQIRNVWNHLETHYDNGVIESPYIAESTYEV